MNKAFHYELYVHEWARRDQLAAALGIPLGLVMALGSGLAFLVTNYSLSNEPLCWAFLSFLSFATYGLLRAGYFLVRSYHGFTYSRHPYSGQLLAHWEDLKKCHENFHEPNGSASEEFENGLIQALAAATDINAKNNRIKSAYLYRAVSAIIFSLVFTLAAAVPAIFESLPPLENNTVQNEIHFNPGCLMENNDTKKPKEDNSQKTPPAPPPKPSFPKNKDIRENDTSGGN
jgi:hypothetical protein